MTDDQPRLRLVSDRVAAWEWESFPRGRMRPLIASEGRPKLSEAKAVD